MNNRMIKYLAMSIVVMLAAGLLSGGKADPPQAQPQSDPVHDYINAVRAELANGKVNLINEVMTLNEKEAAVFWPVYNDYETELFALGDRYLVLIKESLVLYNQKKLDNPQAAEMSTKWFQIQQDRLQLYKKYHTLLSEKLSPIQATQFVQIENRVNSVIDVMIMSELPLIQKPEGMKL